MAQNCDKENGSGDPGPAFCIDYAPQPEDSADSLTCPKCGTPKMITREICRSNISCGYERDR